MIILDAVATAQQAYPLMLREHTAPALREVAPGLPSLGWVCKGLRD
jgi:hypothetical protein